MASAIHGGGKRRRSVIELALFNPHSDDRLTLNHDPKPERPSRYRANVRDGMHTRQRHARSDSMVYMDHFPK